MRSLPFSRRLQLVKLLRTRGLRDVERMREDELREALDRLAALSPPLEPPAMSDSPSSSQLMRATSSRAAAPPPELDESFDDPHALPRFREPKLHLPDEARTFLRAIAVKPGLVFFSWDIAKEQREALTGTVELWIYAADFLGVAPDLATVLALDPVERLPVELSATGWYTPAAHDRAAVAAALVAVGGVHPLRLVESNLAQTPPSRPAPPGPLWTATLPPSVSRRLLGKGVLVRALEGGPLPQGAELVREGETRGAGELASGDVPASASKMRARALQKWLQAAASAGQQTSMGGSGGVK